jgi:hypothetical protein
MKTTDLEEDTIMTTSPRMLRCCALVLALSIAGTPAAVAQRDDLAEHPGFVDGSRLAELIPTDLEQVEVVEVNLAGPLLDAITPLLNEQDPGVGKIVNELRGVTAVVASGLDEATSARARALVDEMAGDLERDGWQRLVRVREKGGRTLVLLHYSGQTLDGLTVLGSQEREVTFVNIAGVIDLASISRLGTSMNLPGLDEAAKAVEE